MKLENDLDTDDIRGLVLRLALPSMLAQFVSVFYSIVDRMYIGNIPKIGEVALAGVGICGPIVTLVSSFAILVGVGGAPLMSIRLGQKNEKGARQILANCFLMLTVMALVLTVFVLGMREKLLWWFGAGETTFPYALSYMTIYLCGTFFALMTTGMNQFIICQGFAKVGMKAVMIGAVANIVLDPIFIFGLHLDVRGAALATVISRYVELAIVAGWTHAHGERNPFIRGAYRSMKIPVRLLKSIAIKGMPLLVNEFLWSSGMAILNQCYSTCGLSVVPAMNISSTLYNLGSVVYLSMGNAVGILMGQLLGAGEDEMTVRDENRKMTAIAVVSGVLFGGLMAACSGLFPEIYNTTDEVRSLAAKLILIAAVMLPFNSYTNAAYFTLRSGGQTMVTFLFDSCFVWCCCVPLAFVLSRFTGMDILPLYAICQAMDLLKCAVGKYLIHKGVWIRNLVSA